MTPKSRDTTLAPNAGVPRSRWRRKSEPPSFPTLVPFAARLESLRLQRGYTMRALATRAKISTNHYQDIAHAHANPSVIVLLSLAGALGVSVVDLLESPVPAPDMLHRFVFVSDVINLAAAHKELTQIVERIASIGGE